MRRAEIVRACGVRDRPSRHGYFSPPVIFFAYLSIYILFDIFRTANRRPAVFLRDVRSGVSESE